MITLLILSTGVIVQIEALIINIHYTGMKI